MSFPAPYPWQAEEAELHAFTPKRALFWAKRTGKSRGAMESLARLPGVSRGLLVGPLSTCPQWADLVEAYGFEPIRLYDLPAAQAALRLKEAARAKRPAFAIVNYGKVEYRSREDAKARREGAVSKALTTWKAQAAIIDESHALKSPDGIRAKTVRRLAWAAPWVRLLTGSPSSGHHGDLWGQLVALDRTEWGTYGAFAERYLIRDSLFPSRVLGHVNEAELRARMLQYAGMKRREDCFGPDAWVRDVREVELPAAARRLYEKLAREWLLESEDTEIERVSGMHVLQRLTRLQQLAAGYLVDDAGAKRPVHTALTDAVCDDLVDITTQGDRAVVFGRFREQLDLVGAELRRRGIAVRELNGDTSPAERAETIAAMTRPGPRVALVQTAAGGTGVSFAECAYQLVLSQSFDFTAEDQARDRTYKPGEPRFITHYRAADTVDAFIYETLASKQTIHAAVMNADRASMAFGRLRRPRMKQA